MEKKNSEISGKLIFNLAVVAISIYLIIYFFVSEDGLIDLLKKPDGCNMLIILAALLIYDLNILVDAVVTLIYVRSKYEDFQLYQALKVAFVGVFFSAITPVKAQADSLCSFTLCQKHKRRLRFGLYDAKVHCVSDSNDRCQRYCCYHKVQLFQRCFTNIWSTFSLFSGFTVQLAMTALFLLVSFSHKVTNKLINLIYKIMKKFKFIKNPEKEG